MSIKATKDNANFISKVYIQEASDTDWAKAKPKVKFKYKETNVLDSSTTSELVINKRISEGDIIAVNNNGIKKKILKGSDILQNENLVDNPDPFGDGSGVDLWKLDGNANSATGQHNGTWSGKEQYDTGKFGRAAKFDGNSYINLGNLDSIFTQRSYTVTGWIYYYEFNGTFLNIRNLETGGVDDCKGGLLSAYEEYSFVVEGTGESKQATYPNNPFERNRWYFITIRHILARKTVQLFLNTNFVTELSYKGDLIFNDGITGLLGVHHYDNVYNTYLKGLINQVRVFNRALTDEEVQILYTEEVSKFNVSDLNLSQIPSKIWLIDGSMITTKDSSTTAQLVLPANSVKAFDTLIVNDGTEKEIVVRSVEKDADGNDVVQLGQELALVPSEVAKVDVPEIIVDVEPTEQELLVDDIELEKESSTKTQFVGTSIKNIPISSGMEIILDNKAVVTSDVNIGNMSIVDKVDPFDDGSGVALWKLDGSANDTGGRYDGRWEGNEQYDVGRFGQAAVCSNNDRIIFINNNYAFPEVVTISCWVKINQVNNTIINFVNSNGDRVDLYYWGEDANPSLGLNTWNSDCYGVFYALPNEFVHIVTKFNFSDFHNFELWINNERKACSKVKNNDMRYTSISDIKKMETYSERSEQSFSGIIDQVRIFNRALTEEEVQILYNEEKYKYTLTFPEQPQAPQTCLVPAKGKRVKLTPFQMSYDESSNTLLKEAQEFEKTGRALQYAIKSPKDIEISQLNIDLWKKQ